MKKLVVALIAAAMLVPTVSATIQPVKTEKTTTVVARKSFTVTMRCSADVYGGTSYSTPVIGSVRAGQKVTYLGSVKNNFAKISFGSKTGYVSVDAIDAKG